MTFKFHRFDQLPPYVFAEVIDARIPPRFEHQGSAAFSKYLLKEAKVAVSPGIGFGTGGEGHVRFSLVENEHRIRQAVRNIRRLFAQNDTAVSGMRHAL